MLACADPGTGHDVDERRVLSGRCSEEHRQEVAPCSCAEHLL